MAGKRGNGEGSLYQRQDGTWCAQVRIDGRRPTVYGRTRKEVQDKLLQLRAEAKEGILPPPEQLTVARHLERWLEDVVRHSVKPRTHRSYSDAARLYLTPAIGTIKLTKLQPGDLQKLYSELLARGLSPSTVRGAHATIHAALEQAVAWNYVGRNVASIAKAPKVRRKEVKALSLEEVHQLLKVAGDTRWDALLTLAIATGARQGELLGLKWADCDLCRGTVQLRRQLGRDKTFADTKTGRSRQIDLPTSAVDALRRHRVKQAAERLAAGPEWNDNDLLFCTHGGKPLSWRNVTREYKILLKRAGLPDIPHHALRHTNASLLLLQGVHPKVVQERLGHSDVGITLNIYSHVTPSMGREAAERLNALLA